MVPLGPRNFGHSAPATPNIDNIYCLCVPRLSLSWQGAHTASLQETDCANCPRILILAAQVFQLELYSCSRMICMPMHLTCVHVCFSAPTATAQLSIPPRSGRPYKSISFSCPHYPFQGCLSASHKQDMSRLATLQCLTNFVRTPVPGQLLQHHPSALLSPADYLHTHFQFTPRQQLCHHDHSITLPADIRPNAPEPIAAAGALHFRLGVPSWEGIYARSIICYAVAT